MCIDRVIPINPLVLEPVDFSFAEGIEIPLFHCEISAGFPSPANDYLGEKIDLSTYLVQRPTTTYMLKVRGSSMVDADINEGDILVIDKSLKPIDGKPVIFFVDGEFTVKTFKRINGKAFLMPANPAYRPIELTEEMNLQVWGVVIWVIHKP
ncbi:LexA family protein [Rufibacter hautae]|uniref:Translesion error-prone DNA polymerase V autoproteolytic subunit n=1 Tax=Rufibacter hautae TaxID=2595005 RepID=A0A5B6T959_9BACT|nr:translesion error-prone DNA polymerase V autoproteolytic subunit [Rufibacter hautae]KAA3436718.1 translesion error-prone DNA polymerase V autoproteolytic subunit [Rufibacter hautae]